MMKQFIILLSAIVLAQGLNEEELIWKNPYEKDAGDLLEPFLNEYFELKSLIEEVKQYQQTQELTSLALAERVNNLPPNCLPTDTPFIEAMDSDACNNLTKSLAKAVSLAKEVGSWAYQAGVKVCGKVIDLFRCGNINPVVAMKCVVNDINNLKELIASYKPDVLKFKNEIVALAKELKVEFKECFAAQKHAQAIAEQMIVQAQLCDDSKLQRLH